MEAWENQRNVKRVYRSGLLCRQLRGCEKIGNQRKGNAACGPFSSPGPLAPVSRLGLVRKEQLALGTHDLIG